ncbi:hypothetical protein H2248_008786 [Termitomyces sp. 'cryptogamus']|nr:hypothetical protein H2248_008786 [Termitomyces sp. 'cryptogamus']
MTYDLCHLAWLFAATRHYCQDSGQNNLPIHFPIHSVSVPFPKDTDYHSSPAPQNVGLDRRPHNDRKYRYCIIPDRVNDTDSPMGF